MQRRPGRLPRSRRALPRAGDRDRGAAALLDEEGRLMELTVLGACGTYPGPGGACSGYLLQHEGFNLWMDAGHGTLSELQKHIPVSEVDAVFLSHAHPDHFVDMYPFF